MKGFPLQNLIFMLLALAALAVPLLRVDRPVPAHPAGAAATGETAKAVPVMLRLRLVHAPQTLELTMDGKSVPLRGAGLERQGETFLVSGEAALELDLKATWPPGTPGTMVELRAAPDGMVEQAQNVWAEARAADEIVRFYLEGTAMSGNSQNSTDHCHHCAHHHELEISGLGVSYQKIQALENVSFATSCGNTVALIGPNGAGKSTLLKAIAGLVPRISGSILWRGTKVSQWHCEFAYLPQREDVDWSFPITVRGLVEMGRYSQLGWWRRWRPVDEGKVGEALRSMHLEGLENRKSASCQAVSSSGLSSPELWRRRRMCSCWMSPSTASTGPRGKICQRSCGSRRRRGGW